MMPAVAHLGRVDPPIRDQDACGFIVGCTAKEKASTRGALLDAALMAPEGVQRTGFSSVSAVLEGLRREDAGLVDAPGAARARFAAIGVRCAGHNDHAVVQAGGHFYEFHASIRRLPHGLCNGGHSSAT